MFCFSRVILQRFVDTNFLSMITWIKTSFALKRRLAPADLNCILSFRIFYLTLEITLEITTSNGLESSKYEAAKQWNSLTLSDDMRVITSLNDM